MTGVEFFIALIALAALWVLFNVPILYYTVGLNGLFFLLMGNVFVGVLFIVLAVDAHFWQERDRTPPATMDATPAPDKPILSAQKLVATDESSQGAGEGRDPDRETPAMRAEEIVAADCSGQKACPECGDVFTVPNRFDGHGQPKGVATTRICARCLSQRGKRVPVS